MTSLFSIWCPKATGWLGQRGPGYSVSVSLDGQSYWFYERDRDVAIRQFERACRRTFLRRLLPWLALPDERDSFARDEQDNTWSADLEAKE